MGYESRRKAIPVLGEKLEALSVLVRGLPKTGMPGSLVAGKVG
jgi:hypothetical protein